MKNLTPEMIEKANKAKSAEELFDLAKACGVEITAGEAATYFAQLNSTSDELSDDELVNVSGGCNNFSVNDDNYEDRNQWLIFSKL